MVFLRDVIDYPSANQRIMDNLTEAQDTLYALMPDDKDDLHIHYSMMLAELRKLTGYWATQVVRGDEVKAGQLLFALERQSETAALEQAEKNLAQAKAGLTLSESTFQRRKELRDSPSGVSTWN